eukprot:CAMPEP_0178442054 /NCGR_PEP_ID=MMETSP0689_2-20121128/37912_1 /TAXON_ID=160604 /ORGANISM="Amphidinium massartii, Strain CS-259" /LENGTH=63 /DNA_ID=CAMNT_0020065479 /DNA_START=145 /DNA_END=336 /DNA_ORIENTATION=+
MQWQYAGDGAVQQRPLHVVLGGSDMVQAEALQQQMCCSGSTKLFLLGMELRGLLRGLLWRVEV